MQALCLIEKVSKMRLDNLLVEKGYFDSRTKAKQAILRGEICVDGVKVIKPSYEIITNDPLIKYEYLLKFVSLGGYKLKKAIDDFSLNVNDFVVADIGASTGGFTDCLIQHGAKKVYAVDLNDTLLHKSLKNSDKVVEIIKNARYLVKSDFNDPLDMLVADLSFISAKQVLDVFSSLLVDNKLMVLLIKPQFELDKKVKLKNGIVRDDKLHTSVCLDVYDLAIKNNLAPLKITTAPIDEKKNVEYLMLFSKNGKVALSREELINFINIH